MHHVIDIVHHHYSYIAQAFGKGNNQGSLGTDTGIKLRIFRSLLSHQPYPTASGLKTKYTPVLHSTHTNRSQSSHSLIGQLVKWIPGTDFPHAGRCLWRFHFRTFPQAESLSRKYRVPQKRCSSSQFQTPAYFTVVPRREAVCSSRELSWGVVVALDIDRDELDNEIQDPFFRKFSLHLFFPKFCSASIE